MLLMIPTLIGAALLVFFLLRLLPGDVCEVRLAGSGLFVSQEAIDICREDLGLDDPLYSQFIDFVGGYFTGDLGEVDVDRSAGHPRDSRCASSSRSSSRSCRPLVAVIIALPLGIISAVKQNTWIDYVVRAFSIAGIGIPSFWLGIMIILGLLIVTQAVFGAGWMPPINYVSPFEDPLGNLAQLIWPALATGYRYSAVATRMTRSAMLEGAARGLRADRLVRRDSSSGWSSTGMP